MWPRDEVHAILHLDSGINMDAGVAGKRKHFDLDEDTTNRKVNFFVISRTFIPSLWYRVTLGCSIQTERKDDQILYLSIVPASLCFVVVHCFDYYVHLLQVFFAFFLLFSQKHLAEDDEKKHTSIVFSLKEEIGSLARALKLFEVLHSFTCI